MVQKNDVDNGMLIPDESLIHIFLYLSIKNLGRIASVNQRWNRVLRSEESSCIIWKRALEDQWWIRSSSNHYQICKEIVQEQILLAQVVQEKRFARDCDSRQILLVSRHGSSRRVVAMLKMFHDFWVTFSEDGIIRYWKLPLEGNRPTATDLFDNGDAFKISSVRSVGAQRVAFLTNKGIKVIRFHLINSANDEAGNNSTLGVHVCQNIVVDSGNLTSLAANSTAIATSFSNGIIKVFQASFYGNTTGIQERSCPQTNEGDAIAILQGHQSGCSVSFMEKDYILLSCSSDETIRIWDYKKQQCLSSIRFDGAIAGGPSILGRKGNLFIVLTENLDQRHSVFSCEYNIPGGSSGAIIRKRKIVETDGSPTKRMVAFELYGRSLLCGTADGRLVEFDLETGNQTNQFDNALNGDSILLFLRLGSDKALVLGELGQIQLLDLHRQLVLCQISNRMRPGILMFDKDSLTLFVASNGYLVRAFIFEEGGDAYKQSEHPF